MPTRTGDDADDVRTLVDNLDRGRTRFGAATLLTEADTGRSVSYAGFADLVEGAAAGLLRAGLAPGDRLAVALRGGLDVAVAIWACARGGFVFVGLPTTLRGAQWEFMLGHSGARLALGHPEFITELAAAARAAGLPADRVGTVGAEAPSPLRTPARWRPGAARPVEDDVYAVVYTSGTTGRPKASQLTHRNTMHVARFYLRTLELGPADLTAIHLPFYYVSGHVTQLNPVMLAGGGALTVPRFAPGEVARALRAHPVTFLDLVPSMFPLLLRAFRGEPPATLRVAAYGGSPMPGSTLRAVREHLPALRLFDVYGLSETAGLVCCLPDAQRGRHQGTVGRPVPGAAVRVVDDDGREVPPGHPGELWVRGPMVTPGYLGDPQATAETIPDGWLRTGDVVRIDPAGYVSVLDRKKDMIIRGGVKIYSLELETLLLSHPAIVEAAVVGVPDPTLFESVGAFVVPADGADLDVADVQAWVGLRMAAHAVPRQVRLVPSIPRNRTGKVDKLRLRAELAALRGDGTSAG